MKAHLASRDLAGRVVVVTGASSGLGREAAVQLAREGCRLVLAARRAPDLEETARLCRQQGGEALVVVTDVTVEDQVQRLAQAAVDTWGGIDVWINNAGVTLFALLEEGTFEEHRRVVEVNLFGAMLGARAALPVFRAQGRGTLINVGSVVSQVGQPFIPSYTVSKFALRGLSEALRIELADHPGIHVCSLLPYAIDTPHFQSGANVRGTRARAMPPIQSPEKVARALVGLVRRPRREVRIPRVTAIGLALRWLFPRTSDRLILHALRRWHFDEVPQAPTSGNLREPVEVGCGEVHGLRRPQLRGPSFAAWAAQELVRILASGAAHRLRGWSAQQRSLARA